MFSGDKDLLVKLALDLDLPSILSLCQTNKRANQVICQSDTFWRNKLIQDFGINEPNPKQVYSNIIQNKRFCPRYNFDADYFILNLSLELSKINNILGLDIAAFNYIVDKIFKQIEYPNYFEKTYERRFQNSPYRNKLNKTKMFTPEEYDILVKLLQEFSAALKTYSDRKNLFLAAVIDGILVERIEIEVKNKDLCKYLIY